MKYFSQDEGWRNAERGGHEEKRMRITAQIKNIERKIINQLKYKESKKTKKLWENQMRNDDGSIS